VKSQADFGCERREFSLHLRFSAIDMVSTISSEIYHFLESKYHSLPLFLDMDVFLSPSNYLSLQLFLDMDVFPSPRTLKGATPLQF
jgi:hypothetical protein